MFPTEYFGSFKLIMLSVHPVKMFKNKSQDRLCRRLNEYRKEEKFCDFELRIQHIAFPVHSLILSSVSPYFEVMFKNCFVENENRYMEIKNLDDPEVLELLLTYMYTGDIEVSEDKVEKIVHIANMFQLCELVEFCSKFIKENLQAHNCIGILRFADSHSLDSLCFEAKRYIEKNFEDIINEDEFYELPVQNLRSLLRSENLGITSEYKVLYGTIKWISNNPSERMQYLNEFLNIIRLPLIPKYLIEELIRNCEVKPVVEGLQDYMEKPGALDSSLNNTGYGSVRCQARMGTRRLLYMFGGRGDSILGSTEQFYFHSMMWGMVNYSSTRFGHSAVFLDEKIYIIGGVNINGVLRSVEILDLIKNEAIMASPLHVPRSFFGACVHNSHIYAVGGDTPAGFSIERYVPKDDVWYQHQQLPLQIKRMQVITHNGLFYIIGGYKGQDRAVDSVYSYNPETKILLQLASLNIPRHSFAACILNDHIYVLGGIGIQNQLLKSVERFDISENQWIFMNEMPVAKSNHIAISHNKMVYVYGGVTSPYYADHIQICKTVHAFDPVSNGWFTSKAMTSGRFDMALVFV